MTERIYYAYSVCSQIAGVWQTNLVGLSSAAFFSVKLIDGHNGHMPLDATNHYLNNHTQRVGRCDFTR